MTGSVYLSAVRRLLLLLPFLAASTAAQDVFFANGGDVPSGLKTKPEHTIWRSRC